MENYGTFLLFLRRHHHYLRPLDHYAMEILDRENVHTWGSISWHLFKISICPYAYF